MRSQLQIISDVSDRAYTFFVDIEFIVVELHHCFHKPAVRGFDVFLPAASLRSEKFLHGENYDILKLKTEVFCRRQARKENHADTVSFGHKIRDRKKPQNGFISSSPNFIPESVQKVCFILCYHFVVACFSFSHRFLKI